MNTRILHSRSNHASHVTSIIGSAFCLLIFIAELAVSFDKMSPVDCCCAAIYLLMLLLSAACPKVAYVAISVLSIVEMLLPVTVGGPTTLWGVWFSLAWLANRVPLWVSLPLALGNTGACLLSPLLYAMPVTLGTVCMSASFTVAFCIGYAFRWKAYKDQLLAEKALADKQIRYQQERLAIAHTVHDSITGSLIYAIYLCRLHADNANDAQSTAAFKQLEDILSQTVHDIRSDVLSPLRAEEAASQDQPESGTNQPPAALHDMTLNDVIRRQQERLASLGFIGIVDVDVDYAVTNHPDMQQPCISIVLELTNNIMKHGQPGCYVLRVTHHDDSICFFASNQCAQSEQQHHQQARPRSLASMVASASGSMHISNEDDEWSVSITIPCK